MNPIVGVGNKEAIIIIKSLPASPPFFKKLNFFKKKFFKEDIKPSPGIISDNIYKLLLPIV